MRAGVDIGGTFIKAGLIEESNGSIICHSTIPFPIGKGEDAVWDGIYNQVFALLTGENYTLSDLPFIGVAVPGSTDQYGEIVIDSHNLNFHNTPIKKELERRFGGTPVKVMNDANAATLAEHKFGILKGSNTAVLITLGTGVGGGLILGGKLFNGGNGNGVEIGHMTLKYDGAKHACGNVGCFETYCSSQALTRDPKWATDIDMINAVIDNDEKAIAIFKDYVDALSSGIVSITNLLDPEIVAIGGGLSNIGDLLLKPLRESVYHKSFYKKISY